jgi:hypothetical protein
LGATKLPQKLLENVGEIDTRSTQSIAKGEEIFIHYNYDTSNNNAPRSQIYQYNQTKLLRILRDHQYLFCITKCKIQTNTQSIRVQILIKQLAI